MLALLSIPGAGHAQEASAPRTDRFYSNKVRAEGDDGVVFQGRLTSSTFFFQEAGDSLRKQDPMTGDSVEVADNASPVPRLFTELRAQIDAVTAGVTSSKVHADVRGRFNLPCELQIRQDNPASPLPDYDACRTQSGTFGENEYDVRELYYEQDRSTLDFRVGRQYIVEAGAYKVDGVKAEYPLDGHWSLVGFGGLYPSRISRSVVDDYAGTVPLIAGLGGAYRYQRYFGSVGAASVVPLVDSLGDPRTFVTSNGYWRPDPMIDVYHFVSVDITGTSTKEEADRFTNVSLGLNYKPVDDLRLTLALNHFSTDTLNEFEIERLERRGEQDIIQNNVDVLRVAAQLARVGASLALMDKRFEVSTSFAVRHRPPESLCSSTDLECDDTAADTEDAWSGEAMLSLVDRQSIAGLRLGVSVINMFGLYELGLGNDSYGRSNHLVARIDASRALMNEQVQLDVDLAYLHAEDVGQDACAGAAVLACYGDTVTDTVSGGATVFYRFLPDWFLLASANAGLQMFEAQSVADRMTRETYSNTAITGFLRLAYRF